MIDDLTAADLRALRVFRAVADAGGFGGAERILGVRQSTISVQMSGLESRLGFRLCHRGRGGFRLTDQGEALLRAHDHLSQAMSDFVATARDLSEDTGDGVRLGVMYHRLANDALSIVEILRAFRRAEPKLRLEVTQDARENLRDAVLSRSLDMAIGAFSDDDPRFALCSVAAETHHVYCGPSHPWWQQPAQDDYATLKAADWIHWLHMPTPTEGELIKGDNVVATAANLDTMSALMEVESVIGYLPRQIGDARVEAGRLWRVTEAHPVSYGISLMSRAGQDDSAGMATLRQIVCQVAGGCEGKQSQTNAA